jgi:thioesterase domain-containing protein
MGGSIAYEVAALLQKLGKTVKFVFMFDSWAFFSNDFRRREFFIEYITKQNKDYAKLLVTVNNEESKKLIDANWGLLQLLVDYKPRRSNQIRIILFKAEQVDEYHATNIDHKDNHWSNYCTSVTTYLSPGNHSTILENEGLINIVRTLNSFLA